jgi:glycosyltransferase involved in cell wall biosynthesis
MTPRVSVIMPVYNGEKYLDESIKSILNQTFRDFEFIVLDDGSFDSTPRLLANYAASDSRVFVHHFAENQGLSSMLNFGIRQARGAYIARMDSDDVSLPERLEKQIGFMDAHPDVGVCSTGAEITGEKRTKKWQHDASHDVIHARMLFVNAIAHPTVMLRASTLQKYELEYDPDVRYAQDYEFWSRAITKTHFANLSQILLKYRVHPDRISSKHSAQQLQMYKRIYHQLLAPLGIEASDAELEVHQKIRIIKLDVDFNPGMVFLQQVRLWLEKVLHANRKVKLIASHVLESELGSRWTSVCCHYQGNPLSIAPSIFASPLQFNGNIGASKMIELFRFIIYKKSGK